MELEALAQYRSACSSRVWGVAHSAAVTPLPLPLTASRRAHRAVARRRDQLAEWNQAIDLERAIMPISLSQWATFVCRAAVP